MLSSSAWKQLIETIHGSGRPLVLAISGGGSRAIADLLEIPGGSQSVLEATVPYSAAALEAFLVFQPEQACSEQTARAMAMAAWNRAGQLAVDKLSAQVVGVGCTASLTTWRPKRGGHRIHVAWQTAQETGAVSLELDKSTRTRQQEEAIATNLVLLAVGKAVGVATEAAQESLDKELSETETLAENSQHAEPSWTQLLLGETEWVAASGTVQTPPRVIFPGSFNPMHEGHRQMAEVAEQRLGAPVVHELSVNNADKPPLDFLEIARRLRTVQDQAPDLPLILTRAPTFLEKAKLLPGCTFVVGADTMVRIADPRFYPGGDEGLQEAIRRLDELDCRFLVFGRLIGGSYQTLKDLSLPPLILKLCDEVSRDEFRVDISSTDMRAEHHPRQK